MVGVAFSACDDPKADNPTLITHEGDPVLDFLNTPPEANSGLQITEDNKNQNIVLTASQPTEYGYAATVDYVLQMSLDKDFTTPAVAGDEIPALVELGTFQNLSNISVPLNDVAQGIFTMLDITEETQVPTDYMPVYMRLRANVVTDKHVVIPNTAFTSNTICYKNIQVVMAPAAQIAPDQPTNYYVRGEMNNWLNDQFDNQLNLEELEKYNFLTTQEANTYLLPYIEIATTQAFKIAGQSWADLNLTLSSSPTMDEWIDCLWNDQANINVANDFAGAIYIQGKGEAWKVKFVPSEAATPGQASGIYLRGSMNDWLNDQLGDNPTNLEELPKWEFYTTKSANVWETGKITITISSDTKCAEFKVADADWSAVNLGGNGTSIVPAQKYALGTDGNIKIEEDFTGIAVLTYIKATGRYYLSLRPVTE